MKSESEIRAELLEGLQTAFMDSALDSNLAYRPEFLSNNHEKGRKVLVSVEQELISCDEFKISVAFITKSGITPLLQILKELEQKGIPGKILTTDYLSFSEPEALEKLASLKNIELKMFCTDDESGGFHTKGYIFKKEEVYHIIIGSSNMTMNAVTKNREWNTKIVSTGSGEFTQQLLEEFEELWSDKKAQPYEVFIEQYRRDFLKAKMIREQRKQAVSEQVVDFDSYRLEPNKMQVAFVKNLLEMSAENINRALLISATGTGKTFASAFAVREMKPARVLFVVHREQIAKQTIESYKRVFGSSHTYGLISGSSHETDADFIFSTMQMMRKPEIHNLFRKDEFNFIILDEYDIIGLSREAA